MEVVLMIRSEEGFTDLERDNSSNTNTSTRDVSIGMGLTVHPSPWLKALIEGGWNNKCPVDIVEVGVTRGKTTRTPIMVQVKKGPYPSAFFENAMLSAPLASTSHDSSVWPAGCIPGFFHVHTKPVDAPTLHCLIPLIIKVSN
jgi:hypothetical protein